MAEQQTKKMVLSLVQPSGDLTIGNYLGAIRNFVTLQEQYTCFFGVANLHAITVTQKAADLRRRTREVLATFMACGLDPDKTTLFVQSDVHEHAELAWVFNSLTSIGQLQRMTQFKEKAATHADNLNSALLTYPVLMAADILLYQADYVPVGEDQKQHLEFTRDTAERFNRRYSDTFTVPEPLMPKISARVMSLKNPQVKMSKSDPDENAYLLIRDDADVIRRKIARAVTDSAYHFAYTEEQPGLKNLIDLYASFSGLEPQHVVEKFRDGEGYATFKTALAELIVEKMGPIRERLMTLLDDREQLDAVRAAGAEAASHVARRTLSKVYRKVGF